jgi:hypothetical protein
MVITLYFEIIGQIEQIETIATGGNIRDISVFRGNMGQVDSENSRGLPWLGSRAERSARLSSTGMKPMELAERNSKSRDS